MKRVRIMSEINKEMLITKIMNSMMKELDEDQMKALKNQLHIHLHDVEIRSVKYELAESIQNSDVIKLNYFENSLKTAKYSKGTINQYIRTVKALRNFLQKDFDKITGADVKYYLAYHQTERNWSDATIKNNIHYIQAFFKFLDKEELLEKNPMLKIEKVRSEKIIKKPFSPEELEKLRVSCRDNIRDAALIEFLYATGVRVDELTQLKWKDIDARSLSLKVKGKGKKEREVQFSEKAAFYLGKYFDERCQKEKRSREEMLERPLFAGKKLDKKTHDYGGVNKGGIRFILKSLGKKAGVENVHPHRFRRTFATDAIRHGMPLEHLKILMGHKNYDTTLIYAQIKTADVEQSYKTCCA